MPPSIQFTLAVSDAIATMTASNTPHCLAIILILNTSRGFLAAKSDANYGKIRGCSIVSNGSPGHVQESIAYLTKHMMTQFAAQELKDKGVHSQVTLIPTD